MTKPRKLTVTDAEQALTAAQDAATQANAAKAAADDAYQAALARGVEAEARTAKAAVGEAELKSELAAAAVTRAEADLSVARADKATADLAAGTEKLQELQDALDGELAGAGVELEAFVARLDRIAALHAEGLEVQRVLREVAEVIGVEAPPWARHQVGVRNATRSRIGSVFATSHTTPGEGVQWQ